MVAQAIDAGVMGFAGKALDESAAMQLTASIFRSGKLEHLLAGALVEDGKKWTAKDADANAEAFGELTDPIEKQQMLNGIVEVLAHFFRSAPLSSTPSPSVSTEAAEAAVEPPTPETRSTGGVLVGSGAA